MRHSRSWTLAMLVALALSGLSCSASRFIGYSIKPDAPLPQGRATLNGLREPVRVTYDRHEVPHIVAQSEHDLWFAIGWVQARDRLFQMDMLRRMASGRVSELFGAQAAPDGMPFSDTLGMDRFFRVMGLAQQAAKSVAGLNETSLDLGRAYIAGVNAWIAGAERLPIEYRLLDETPAPWTLEDVMTVARLTDFQLSVNMAHELLRYLLLAELGPEAQQEIFPSTPPAGPYIIERSDRDFRDMPRVQGAQASSTLTDILARDAVDPAAWAPAATAFLDLLGRVQEQTRPFVNPAASNSWVVSGSRTANGKPILANDPHLLHNAPAVFYLMHIQAPGIDAIGAALPGTPILSLGRNRNMGWAPTNTFADVQDIYLERLDPADPTRYLTPDGSRPFVIEPHVIREKTGKGRYVEHRFDLRYTRNGPVLNDAMIDGMPADAPPLALKTNAVWPSDEVAAMVKAAKAGSVQGFFDALSTWGSPIQNWIAADDAGHIGYFPMGHVPLRVGFDGTLPVPGWTGEFDWRGHIPFDQLPRMIDPPSGMIVTANNQVVPPEDYPYPYSIDTMQGYRADRIRDVLQSQSKWTADGIRELQTDAYAKQADRLLPALLAALDGAALTPLEQEALAALRTWDRVAGIDSVGASVFFATYREAWKLTLDDDLPPLFHRLVAVFSYTYGFFDRLWAEAPQARVFDRKDTPQVEDRDTILRMAFSAAVRNLSKSLGGKVAKWTWGRLHTITFHHPFGTSVGGAFDEGPHPIPGAWDTVWAAGFALWAPEYAFPTIEGPALRHVLDFSAPEDSRFVLDLGQSGWPKTPGYTNAVQDWLHGRLWSLSMDPAVYGEGARGTLELAPAP